MTKKEFLENLKNKYKYIDFSNEKILTIINEIEFSKKINTDKVEQIVIKEILVLIKSSLQNNDISIISNVINQKSFDKLEKEQIETLISFAKFYNYFGVELDIDIASLLIKNNPFIEKSVSSVINSNQVIDNSNINLLNLVDAYYINNGIELNDFYEQENDVFVSTSLNGSSYHLCKKLLTREEEKKLIIEYRNGSADAYNTLIEKNLGLVLKIAGKYQNRGVPMDDLFQEGCIGLMKAIEKFDIDREVKLSTYAIPWIRQTTTRCVYNTGKTIRIPVPMYEKISKYKTAVKQLKEKNNRKPTIEELAKHLRWTEKSTKNVATLPLSLDSLDRKINTNNDKDNDSFTLGSLLEVDDLENTGVLRVLPREILSLLDNAGLTERQKYILIKRYGLCGVMPLTCDEIAKEYGVTRQAISQSEVKALNVLRNYSGINQFLVYTDNPEESSNNIDLFRQKYNEKTNKKSKTKKKVKSLKK